MDRDVYGKVACIKYLALFSPGCPTRETVADVILGECSRYTLYKYTGFFLLSDKQQCQVHSYTSVSAWCP